MTWAEILCILITCIHIKMSLAVFPIDPLCMTCAKKCWPVSCSAGGCYSLVTWTDAGDYVHFELTTVLPVNGDRYAALGFSANRQMLDSSIVMCRVTEAGQTSLEMGYTSVTGHDYTMLSTNYGMRNPAATLDGTILNCTFDRIKTPTQNPQQIRSLTKTFHLLHASGSITGGTPQYHGPSRSASGPIMDFVVVVPTTPTTPTPTSKAPTAHARVAVSNMCLMMIIFLLR